MRAGREAGGCERLLKDEAAAADAAEQRIGKLAAAAVEQPAQQKIALPNENELMPMMRQASSIVENAQQITDEILAAVKSRPSLETALVDGWMPPKRQ